jgi:hypothetical protein
METASHFSQQIKDINSSFTDQGKKKPYNFYYGNKQGIIGDHLLLNDI